MAWTRSQVLAATTLGGDAADRVKDTLAMRTGTDLYQGVAGETTVFSTSPGIEQGGLLVGVNGYLLDHEGSMARHVAELYREHGPGLAEHIEGSFRIVLHDPEERETYCIADRVGRKYTYYTATGDGFVASSLLSPLLAHPGVDNDLDRTVFTDYLRGRASHLSGGRTLVDGVRKTRGGEVVRFDGDRVRTQRYWDVPRERRSIPPGEAVARIEDILRDEVERLVDAAGDPITVSFSGGLDSGLLTSLLRDATDRTIETYTWGYRSRMHELGERMAGELGTDHHTIQQTYGLPDRREMWELDDPNYSVCRWGLRGLFAEHGLTDVFHGVRSQLAFPVGIERMRYLERVRFLHPLFRAVRETGMDGAVHRVSPAAGKACHVLGLPYRSAMFTALKRPPYATERRILDPELRAVEEPEARMDRRWDLEQRSMAAAYNYLDLHERLGPFPAAFFNAVNDYCLYSSPRLLAYTYTLPMAQRLGRRHERTIARDVLPDDITQRPNISDPEEINDFKRCVQADRDSYDSAIDRLTARNGIRTAAARRYLKPERFESYASISHHLTLYLLERWIEAYIDRDDPWNPPERG